MNKSKIIPTIKKWLLMISMSLGIGGYFLILSLNLGQETNHQIATVVTNMLPYLLFVMLFLEFSKIEPRDLFPKKWLWMVFAFQIVMAFVTLASPQAAGMHHGKHSPSYPFDFRRNCRRMGRMYLCGIWRIHISPELYGWQEVRHPVRR